MVTRTNLETLSQVFRNACEPEDVFGTVRAGEDPAMSVQVLYRQFARVCHVDLAEPSDRPLADLVMRRLIDWKQRADYKLARRTYGNRLAASQPPPSYVPVDLQLRRRRLRLTGLLEEGAFATLHHAEYEGEEGVRLLAKIAREPVDNDLLEREQQTLGLLHEPDGRPEVESFLRHQRSYVPSLLTGFVLIGEHGARHRALLQTVPDARFFTARALREEPFPDGMEPRHVYWILRRLLLTLWMAHLKGIAHGAVTPNHLLVFPDEHGIVLLDWSCAADLYQQPLSAYDPRYEAFYPPEVFRKNPVGPNLDLYMAVATAAYLLGANPPDLSLPDTVPGQVADTLRAALHPDPCRRPQDAEALHNRLGDAIEAATGPRVFSPLYVP